MNSIQLAVSWVSLRYFAGIGEVSFWLLLCYNVSINMYWWTHHNLCNMLFDHARLVKWKQGGMWGTVCVRRVFQGGVGFALRALNRHVWLLCHCLRVACGWLVHSLNPIDCLRNLLSLYSLAVIIIPANLSSIQEIGHKNWIFSIWICIKGSR